MANVTMIPARVNRRAKREEKETKYQRLGLQLTAVFLQTVMNRHQVMKCRWSITRNTLARIPDGNLQAFMPMMVSVAPTPRREKTLIE